MLIESETVIHYLTVSKDVAPQSDANFRTGIAGRLTVF